MTEYADGRYRVTDQDGASTEICHDINLNRKVCIHWVAPAAQREQVRSRLMALQSVRSPHVALIYDLVQNNNMVGVVEEHLGAVVTTASDRHLYDFCAGVAALHDKDLAHGALDGNSLRTGPLNHSRICNLAFGDSQLDDPSRDQIAFLECLNNLGGDAIVDSIFQQLRTHDRVPFSARPFRDRLAALLLRDRHRALAYWRGTSIELNARTRSTRLAHPLAGVANATVHYDGTRFFLADLHGEVYVNNVEMSQGDELPGSCVIALGGSHRPWHERYFITFDQSHPEVT